MSNLSPSFYKKLIQVASNVNMSPEDILVVMIGESNLGGGSNSGSKAYNPDGHASGLIQFMPDTLKGLGFGNPQENRKSVSDRFKKLSEVQQLDYVEKAIKSQQNMVGFRFKNATQYYIANFLPVALGFPGMKDGNPNAVIAEQNPKKTKHKNFSIDFERQTYKANSALDVDKDGKITYKDIDKRIQNIKNSSQFKTLVSEMRSAQSDYPRSISTKNIKLKGPRTGFSSFLKSLLDKLSSTNDKLLIKVSNDNNIASLEFARLASLLIEDKLGVNSFVHTDNNNIEIECDATNYNNLLLICNTIKDSFNKKYNSNIEILIKKNSISNLPPIKLKHDLLNHRMFKLANVRKNG